MSFKGSFSKIQSQRIGHIIIYSFRLECTNWLRSETIDVALFDCYHQQPFIFRDLHFGHGQYMDFNQDTVDWSWCQGDCAAIIDKQNRILQQWTLQLKEYAPGECPECHGTHKCKACQGQGYFMPTFHGGLSDGIGRCSNCGGTGICRTCHVPYRKIRSGGAPFGLTPHNR